MERERISRQDLIYAARALRVSASVDEARASDPAFLATRHVFEQSADAQRKLAAKFERRVNPPAK